MKLGNDHEAAKVALMKLAEWAGNYDEAGVMIHDRVLSVTVAARVCNGRITSSRHLDLLPLSEALAPESMVSNLVSETVCALLTEANRLVTQ